MPDEVGHSLIPQPVSVPDGAPPFDDALPAGAVTPDELQDLYPENVSLPESPAGSADPGPWPSQIAMALAEALSGARPVGQIVPWTTIQARKRISQLGPMLADQRRPHLRRLIVNSPAADVLELSLVVGYGDRVRAVAVRLERRPPCPAAARHTPPARRHPADLWYCTAIEAA